MSDYYNTNKGAVMRTPAGGFAAPMAGAGDGYSHQSGAGFSYALTNEDKPAQFGAPFGAPSDDLLALGTNVSDSINYEQIVYVSSVTALPKDLGKSLIMSRENGNLRINFASQALDVNGTCPVGNHDLIKDIHMDIYTTSKQPFVTNLKTIAVNGNEHFFGNNGAASATASNSVAYTWMPSMFNKNVASADILSRTITSAQRDFLSRFPGQTADTLSDHVTQGMRNDPHVLVRYDPTGERPSSAVTMWYDSMVDPKTNSRLYAPLQALPNGMAQMRKDVYDKVADIAAKEISRYISLGDMTSKNFAVEVKPFPVNGKEDVGLGDFDYHYPGVNPASMMTDPVTLNPISARELFEKTPITYSLTFTAFYKKINIG